MLVSGKEMIDAPTLVRLIEWPAPKEALEWWGSERPPHALREWLLAQPEATCKAVFRCVTARRALPVSGPPCTIRLEVAKSTKVGATDGACAVHDGRAAAEASTCFNALKLPKYESVDQVDRGMRLLLAEGGRFSAE